MTSSNQPIEADDFSEWKAHPITARLFDFLREQRQDVLEAWASGQFTAEIEGGTIQKNAEALGRVGCLNDLINLTIEDINE